MLKVIFTAVLLVGAGLTSLGTAAEPDATTESRDLAALPTEALIDQLMTLDSEAPGVSGVGVYDVFMAEDTPATMTMGLLPVNIPDIPPVMRELVLRGGHALPLLVRHIRDGRPTHIVVGNTEMAMQGFNDEYDPRYGSRAEDACSGDCPTFETYTVTVGDLCQVLIGQIVGRNLISVRYQPSAILYVNSPVMTPALADRIEKDWSGVDAGGLEASLLEDLGLEANTKSPPENGWSRREWPEIVRERTEDRHDNALRRLRIYYPQTYAGLTGENAVRRKAFEARERDALARAAEQNDGQP